MAAFADELFKQLSKIPLLTPSEERRLWAAYKDHDSLEARQELIYRYQPLVCKIVSILKPSEQVYLDLFQEGVVGLVEAVERFEPQRGFKFSTYARFRIKGRALTYLQKLVKHPQNMSESDQLTLLIQNIPDPDQDPDEHAEDSFLLDRIYECVDELPEKEKNAFVAVVLKEEEPKQVAKRMKISRSYLSRLLKKSWKRIRDMLVDIRDDMY
ncbi:MAG: sigma-70 family RNA polymerase sigma factor [bacterium]|nr:sigma-70 family RNA polymerase sigma factor [bacterium]